MYGLVNQAIEDLVKQSAGEAAWEQIKEKASVKLDSFEASVIYDDAVTLALVAAASELLGKSAEHILHAFGRHWILYTGREGWSDVFSMTGDDMETFLAGLDEMHARVRVAMPEADMPQFTLNEHDDYLVLEYHSSRDGLAPMVRGLLEGLGEYFGEAWSIEQTGYRADDGFDSFKLRRAGEDVDTLIDAKAA